MGWVRDGRKKEFTEKTSAIFRLWDTHPHPHFRRELTISETYWDGGGYRGNRNRMVLGKRIGLHWESQAISHKSSQLCVIMWSLSFQDDMWDLSGSLSPLTVSSLIPVSRQLIVYPIKSERCIVLFHQVGLLTWNSGTLASSRTQRQAGLWPALRLWCAQAHRGYDFYYMAISLFSESPQECSGHSKAEVTAWLS